MNQPISPFVFRSGKKMNNKVIGNTAYIAIPYIMNCQTELRTYGEFANPDNKNIGICLILEILVSTHFGFDQQVKRSILYLDPKSRLLFDTKGRLTSTCAVNEDKIINDVIEMLHNV